MRATGSAWVHRLEWVIAFAGALPFEHVVVDAQSEVAVIPGEPLRLEVVGPAGAPIGTRCSGRVTSAAQDTLIVASAGTCKQGSYLASLQVIRGDRGSRIERYETYSAATA